MIRIFRIAVPVVSFMGVAAPSMAAMLSYSGSLSGPNESPPNSSPGIGTSQVDYEDAAHTLRVQVTFSGLEGVTTSAHIHGPTATAGTGTASVITTTPTFAGFPVGVSSGTYDHTLDLTQASSWNASYLTANGGTPAGAEAAFAAALAEGKTYLNIHSSLYGGGEIRGFLVPEPATLVLAVIGGLSLARRRQTCRRMTPERRPPAVRCLFFS